MKKEKRGGVQIFEQWHLVCHLHSSVLETQDAIDVKVGGYIDEDDSKESPPGVSLTAIFHKLSTGDAAVCYARCSVTRCSYKDDF